ncbi:MAG: GntR family transcriptional regulator [Bacillota bacterium]
MDINRNSPVPVYYQIQNQFRQKIKNEELIPGEKLPSERELSNKLEISRSTIRKAIRGLINEGLCINKQGKGIFVSDDKITININHISGTSSFIKKMGMDIHTKVIEKKIVSDKKINSMLDNERSELLYLKRVRYIDEEPLMLENSFLPLSRYKGLSNENFDGSLYTLLENQYNVKPKKSQGKFDIKIVDEEESKLLNIHLNTGLLVKEVVVFDEDDIPMEFSKTSYRSDKFTFAINSIYCD